VARGTFGGSITDWLVNTTSGGLLKLHSGTVDFTFWSAKTGGTRYTDLLDENSNATTSISVSGHQIPTLYGPDSVSELWAEPAGGTERYLMSSRSGAAGGGLDAEGVRDTMAAALVAGSNVTITPNDAADTITIASTGGGLTAEDVRDTIGSALVAGSNVTITVNDPSDTITIASTGGGGGGSADSFTTTYGGVTGGVTNNATALASASGNRVYFPPGTYRLTSSAVISLAAGTHWFAAPGTVTISFDGTATEVFRTNGNNIVLEGINVTRNADVATILMDVRGGFNNLHMRHCVLDGKRDTLTVNFCHAFRIGESNFDTFHVEKSKITRNTYGLFMNTAATATVTDVVFERCTFANNYQSDLEFNAPNPAAVLSSVWVKKCVFKDNQKTTSGGGFGVGFANVFKGRVVDCDFTNYFNEAVHVEDESEHIKVRGNTMAACGKNQGSYIQVISNSFDVVISENTCDARTNTNGTAIPIINVLQGGTGTTPGGRTPTPPKEVKIVKNTVYGSTATTTATRGMYLEDIDELTVEGNILRGSGAVAAGAYTGTTLNGIEIVTLSGTGGRNISVKGNEINGWNQGISIGRGTGILTTQNAIRGCSAGIAARNCGTGSISGNFFTNCLFPLLTGSFSSSGSKPMMITNNHASGCSNPMVTTDAFRVKVPTGATTQTVGGGKTLSVDALVKYLPIGAVVTFSGTGVMTLSSASNAGATSITGTVSVASITATETGTGTTPYSPVSGDNHRLTGNNAEDILVAAGGIGYAQDHDGY